MSVSYVSKKLKMEMVIESRKILLSNDDEGNGYHALYYDFTEAEDLFEDVDTDEEFDLNDLPYCMRTHIKDGGILSDFIVLG